MNDARDVPGQQAQILVVNDHEWSARSLETVLQTAGHKVVRVFTVAQAKAAIATWLPDAIILDTQLPDGDGPELCAFLLRHGLVHSAIPIVITTAAPAGRTERIRALQAGAADFIPLPLDSEVFGLKLANLLAVRRTVRDAVLIDESTGCCTPVGLFVRGNELASVAASQGLRMSCVRLRVNGTTRSLDRRVRGVGRRSDVFALLGDGELAVLAPVTTTGGAKILASRLAESVRNVMNGLETVITVGYATSDAPGETGALRSLLHWAERALASATRSGSPLGHHELDPVATLP